MTASGDDGAARLLRERLRRTFGEDADRYDRARPGYPDEMVGDLITLAGVGPGSRVLEIGCGTGQLTLALVRRGLDVTCVELGAELAALARRKVAQLQAPGSALVVDAAFEDWSAAGGTPGPFDLVVAATAFHWIDPAVRVPRSVAMLRPGGALAVISTEHVAGSDAFFEQVQDCYVRWDPDVDAPTPMTPPDQLPTAMPELDDSPLLERVQLRRYVWDLTYSADSYVDLLLTYSGHRALPRAAREGLLGCVRSLIEQRGGQVTKTYLTELRVARRPG